MLDKIIIMFSVFAGLLVACRILLEYWFRSQKHMTRDEVSSLTLLEKIVYAFGRFCDKLQKNRELKDIKMEEEFGKGKML